VQGAKAWAPDELALVKRAIDEILERPGGAVVVNAAHRRGVTALRRLSFALRGSEPFPSAAGAWVRTPFSAHLELYDRFFALGDSRDDLYPGTPGYLFVAQLLLHELFHVIDRQSNTPEFLDLAGFVRAGSRMSYSVNTPEEVMALHEWEQQLPLLEAKGDVVGLHRLNRRLARQMQNHPIPTLACIRGPAEAFAEIGSHIVLDPNAPRYLPNALIQFFMDGVLQPDQAAARRGQDIATGSLKSVKMKTGPASEKVVNHEAPS
jgi:hypothetical protein